MATFTKQYNPNRSADWNYGGSKWRLSRSKIDLFLECPRCFYLDNKLGTKRPGMPSFNLNIAVDALFKKEFDIYRAKKEPHPFMKEAGIDAVPFIHAELEAWRDTFTGIAYEDKRTGLTVCGAVDDIWVQQDGELIVVDYKSTSKNERIETLSDSPWEIQYQRQIGVYQWLLRQNGFSVSDTGYLVYANASQDEATFNNTLVFETTLVPCVGSADWIGETLETIYDCLNKDDIPPTGEACEYCPYRDACGKKLLALHTANKKKS